MQQARAADRAAVPGAGLLAFEAGPLEPQAGEQIARQVVAPAAAIHVRAGELEEREGAPQVDVPDVAAAVPPARPRLGDGEPKAGECGHLLDELARGLLAAGAQNRFFSKVGGLNEIRLRHGDLFTSRALRGAPTYSRRDEGRG
jgi:hypothetical protein